MFGASPPHHRRIVAMLPPCFDCLVVRVSRRLCYASCKERSALTLRRWLFVRPNIDMAGAGLRGAMRGWTHGPRWAGRGQGQLGREFAQLGVDGVAAGDAPEVSALLGLEFRWRHDVAEISSGAPQRSVECHEATVEQPGESKILGVIGLRPSALLGDAPRLGDQTSGMGAARP